MCYNRRRGENFTRASVTISEKKWYGVDGKIINISQMEECLVWVDPQY